MLGVGSRRGIAAGGRLRCARGCPHCRPGRSSSQPSARCPPRRCAGTPTPSTRGRGARRVIAVDPRNTSRTCPRCGHCAKENRDPSRLPVCALRVCRARGPGGRQNVLRAGLARQAATAV
ncbi:zinc ribbon domain-containing protein [Micromonospora kangleipakensis]|uniref:zinc ribbon domain-containing protein n=1 Tax=Micromonospora kangleipakensis TaxID=1077942 RepID=UPI003BF7F51B